MKQRKESSDYPHAQEIMVMALVVVQGQSIAKEQDHVRVKKQADLILKFMENMGYECLRRRKKGK